MSASPPSASARAGPFLPRTWLFANAPSRFSVAQDLSSETYLPDDRLVRPGSLGKLPGPSKSITDCCNLRGAPHWLRCRSQRSGWTIRLPECHAPRTGSLTLPLRLRSPLTENPTSPVCGDGSTSENRAGPSVQTRKFPASLSTSPRRLRILCHTGRGLLTWSSYVGSSRDSIRTFIACRAELHESGPTIITSEFSRSRAG